MRHSAMSGGWQYFHLVLCAVAFLKISQKIDSFLAALGINVGRTGGSMLGELLIAGRAVGSAVGGLGGAVGNIFNRNHASGSSTHAPSCRAGFLRFRRWSACSCETCGRQCCSKQRNWNSRRRWKCNWRAMFGPVWQRWQICQQCHWRSSNGRYLRRLH